MAYHDISPCDDCGSPLPAGEERCGLCEAERAAHSCSNCGASLHTPHEGGEGLCLRCGLASELAREQGAGQ
jgi:hypothetical protein